MEEGRGEGLRQEVRKWTRYEERDAERCLQLGSFETSPEHGDRRGKVRRGER